MEIVGDNMFDIIKEYFDIENSDKPYNSNIEYIEDLIKLLDIRIELFREMYLQDKKIDKKYKKLLGVVISKEEFESIVDNDYIINDNLRENINELLQICDTYLDNRKLISLKNGLFIPNEYLSVTFNLNKFERFCLLLSFVPHLNKKYGKIFGYVQDDINLKYPTIDLALKLYFLENSIENSINSFVLFSSSRAKYIFDGEFDTKDYSFLSTPLKVNKRILSFILSKPYQFYENDSPIRLWFPHDTILKLYHRLHHIRDAFISLLSNTDKEDKFLCILEGPDGAGKKHIVKSIASIQNKIVIFVDYQKLLLGGEKALEEIIREILLQDGLLCIYSLSLNTDKDDISKLYRHLKQLFVITDNIFLVMNNLEINIPLDDEFIIIKKEVGKTNGIESREIWKKEIQNYSIEDLDLSSIINNYNFTYGSIKKVIKDAYHLSVMDGRDKIISDDIYESCKKHFSTSLKDLATHIKPIFKWEDLIISESKKTQLKNACSYIKHRYIVYEEYELNRRFSYGKGLNILLKGSPGTGKTMAAHVIANELNMELYKVDLAQIVSKYIGETEKNLRLIFDESSKSNVILFFDEMDALFGKRSEVKDSKDKYSNLETSFLLQKIEEQEGVIIMATNYLENIDQAFIRRIQFIVDFPKPSKDERRKIWSGMFTDKVPISDNVDFEYLADRFELSGGEIKNIVLNSIFMAVNQGSEVTMKHILLSLKQELEKQGKILLKEDFGEYYFYLDMR